jgi:hypothetical protein
MKMLRGVFLLLLMCLLSNAGAAARSSWEFSRLLPAAANIPKVIPESVDDAT